ncbi:MAG: GNAT family N-acetyltransferase [Actinobacteria bacterium]|nr:GNAT family N-acetyltransferase [Actinomycetota bacterium]
MAAGPQPVSDAVLRDGTTVLIRPAGPRDRARIEDYLIWLSEETRRLRFGTAVVDVTGIAERAAELSPGEHITLLALQGGDEGTVVGGAQYFKMAGDRAEMSVSVADAYQGRGLGSILVGRIAELGERDGIGTLVATVLPENHRMIEVFREGGFSPVIRAVPGSVEISFPTTLTDDAARLFEERTDEAARNAVRAILSPGTVAVIGASRDPESIGGRLFRNLLLTGYHGVVYPVNPHADSIQGVRAYDSITHVPGEVDVAFICVPAASVAEVASLCGQKGVRGLVVISSGFAEVGGEGPARQAELVDICRAAGMRMIGPNCMGIANTDPDVLLNGTFASTWPLPGRVGFMSQSGALGIAVMAHTTRLGLGLSSFVSSGNKADVSGNDLLCHWETDPRTDVVLLYLESFGNPRRFARLARRIAERKPIVAVKSGRSSAGARATASHTGAILLASDAAVDAIFRQNGVIRTETLEEMLDVATLLANQPLPAGNRVGIVTNAGGLGILCADAAEAHGLSVTPFSEATVSRLREFLPPEASTANPVDMIASATGEDYALAIRTVATSGDVDALIVIYIPPLERQAAEVARHVAAAVGNLRGAIPALASFVSAEGLPAELESDGVRVPSFAYPEQAAIALARAASLGVWRRRTRGAPAAFDAPRSDEVAALLAGALDEGADWLQADEAVRLLELFGVRCARFSRAGTPPEAAAAAGEIGGAVALKAIGPLHKTEVGAVRLGLAPTDVEAAAAEMRDRLIGAGEPFEGFLVQEMVEGGVEMLVGVAHDPTFGPVVACGVGGTAAELMADVAVRVPPITDVDVSEMVRSLRGFPLLDGYRGSPKTDIAALEDLVLRIGALVELHPVIAEMDCNPVVVTPTGAVVLDVRVRVESLPAPEPVGSPL